MRNCQPFRNLSTGLPDFRSIPGAGVDHAATAADQAAAFVNVRNMGMPYGRGHNGAIGVRAAVAAAQGQPMRSRVKVESTLRTDANRPQPMSGRVKAEPTVRTDFRSPTPPEGVKEQVEALAGNGIWSRFSVYSRQDGPEVKDEDVDVEPRMPVASSSKLPNPEPSSLVSTSRRTSGGVKREASIVDLTSPPRTKLKQRKLSKQSSIIDISDSPPPSPTLNAKKVALGSHNTARQSPSAAGTWDASQSSASVFKPAPRTPVVKTEPAFGQLSVKAEPRTQKLASVKAEPKSQNSMSVKTEPQSQKYMPKAAKSRPPPSLKAEPKVIDVPDSPPRPSPASLPNESAAGSSSSGSDVATHGVKRRLGMGRSRPGMGGYSNKKFKPPL